jgi:hypothetical protein
MKYWTLFLESLDSKGALVLIALIFGAMLAKKIQRTTLPEWNGFLDSLDRHGGHILVGGFWTLTGIVLVMVMQMDTGKEVIGFGLGILSRSMGTHPPLTTGSPELDDSLPAEQSKEIQK